MSYSDYVLKKRLEYANKNSEQVTAGFRGDITGANDNNYDIETIDQNDIGTLNSPDYVSPDYSKIGDMPTYTNPSPYKSPNFGDTPIYQVSSEYSPKVYHAPAYDENKVRAITQEQAAPVIRGLRSAIQRVSSQRTDNPNVRKMTLREALAGYGQGLQSAISQASSTARGLYNQEYAIKSDAAKTNFGAQTEANKINYQSQTDASKINFGAQMDKYKINADALSTESKINYQALADAAKANFNAQYDLYKMKWEDLSDVAKLKYTTQYQAEIAKYNAKLSMAQFNANAKNTMAGMAFQGNLQKQLAEYEASVKKYMAEEYGTGVTPYGKDSGGNSMPTIYRGSSPSSSNPMNPDSIWYDPNATSPLNF